MTVAQPATVPNKLPEIIFKKYILRRQTLKDLAQDYGVPLEGVAKVCHGLEVKYLSMNHQN